MDAKPRYGMLTIFSAIRDLYCKLRRAMLKYGVPAECRPELRLRTRTSLAKGAERSDDARRTMLPGLIFTLWLFFSNKLCYKERVNAGINAGIEPF
jgi:hypothetical protein